MHLFLLIFIFFALCFCHDCSLFTLKTMQYWDGSTLPRLKGLNDLKLRKEMFFQWINSPIYKIDWKDVFSSDEKKK